jgi:hypothetical protein
MSWLPYSSNQFSNNQTGAFIDKAPVFNFACHAFIFNDILIGE